MDKQKKTHVVIDTVLFEEEGGGVCFDGTHEECVEWVNEQGFGYDIKPMTEAEFKYYNNE